MSNSETPGNSVWDEAIKGNNSVWDEAIKGNNSDVAVIPGPSTGIVWPSQCDDTKSLPASDTPNNLDLAETRSKSVKVFEKISVVISDELLSALPKNSDQIFQEIGSEYGAQLNFNESKREILVQGKSLSTMVELEKKLHKMITHNDKITSEETIDSDLHVYVGKQGCHELKCKEMGSKSSDTLSELKEIKFELNTEEESGDAKNESDSEFNKEEIVEKESVEIVSESKQTYSELIKEETVDSESKKIDTKLWEEESAETESKEIVLELHGIKEKMVETAAEKINSELNDDGSYESKSEKIDSKLSKEESVEKVLESKEKDNEKQNPVPGEIFKVSSCDLVSPTKTRRGRQVRTPSRLVNEPDEVQRRRKLTPVRKNKKSEKVVEKPQKSNKHYVPDFRMDDIIDYDIDERLPGWNSIHDDHNYCESQKLPDRFHCEGVEYIIETVTSDNNKKQAARKRNSKRKSSVQVPQCSKSKQFSPANSNTGKSGMSSKRSQTTSKKELFDCEECPFQTDDLIMLVRHIGIHKKNLAQVKSSPCEYTATDANEISSHEAKHSLGLFTSVLSRVSSLKKQGVAKHKANRKKPKYFKCPTCAKKFIPDHYKVIYTHLKTHPELEDSEVLKEVELNKNNQEMRYECNICGHQMRFRNEIMRHHRTAHPEHHSRLHVCDVCGKTFKELKALSCHKLTHLEVRGSNMDEMLHKFKCSECSFGCQTLQGFKTHQKRHSVNSQIFKCSDCDYSTLSRIHLSKHTLIHPGDRFNCQLCPYESNSSDKLTGHMERNHTDKHVKERQYYNCPSCDIKIANFRSKMFLAHLETHPELEDSDIIRELRAIRNGKDNKERQYFNCPSCDIKIANFRSKMFLAHLETHPELKDSDIVRETRAIRNGINNKQRQCYNCPSCDFKIADFRSKTFLAHLETHPELKDSDIVREMRAIRKIKNKKQKQYYNCPSCDFKIADFHSKRFLAHLETHPELEDSDIVREMRAIRNPNNKKQKQYYNCPSCDVKIANFRSKMFLAHLETHPELEDSDIVREMRAIRNPKNKKQKQYYNCPSCDFKIVNFRSKMFLAHLETHPELEDSDIVREMRAIREAFSLRNKCHLCGFKSRNRTEATAHNNSVHAGNKSFICEYCAAAYENSQSLHSHIKRKHSGIKSFICEYCAATYKNSQSLCRHIKVNHSVSNGLEKYTCDVCDKKFKTETKMKKHHKACHSEFCDVCETGFPTGRQLRKHVRSVHRKEYKCCHCEKKLTSQQRLDKHIERCHGGMPNYFASEIFEIQPSDNSDLSVNPVVNFEECEALEVTGDADFEMLIPALEVIEMPVN